MEQIV